MWRQVLLRYLCLSAALLIALAFCYTNLGAAGQALPTGDRIQASPGSATAPPQGKAVNSPSQDRTVYFNNFEGTVGSEWNITTTDVTPVGNRRFLGQFGNDTVTLSLNNLPAHRAVTVSFDLFILKSWDGNNNDTGPDIWRLGAGGQFFLNTTFSNVGYDQAYPGGYPGGSFPSYTGAQEIDTLGYTYYGDSVYLLRFTIPHTANNLALQLSASGLQEIKDESWGLDNVLVTVDSLAASPCGLDLLLLQ